MIDSHRQARRAAAFVAAAAGVAMFVFGAAPAWAAESDALIRQGIELRRAGKDEEALKAFQRAYDADQTPRALAQMGLAEQALGRWGSADRHLRQALESTGDPWMRKNRTAIDDALKSIDRHVGHLEVSGSPAGAEIRVDAELVGRLPLATPVAVTAGGVALEVRAPGYVPIVRATTVNAGELTRETFNLQSFSPVATFPPVQQTVTPPQPPPPPPATVVADSNGKPGGAGTSGTGQGTGSGAATGDAGTPPGPTSGGVETTSTTTTTTPATAQGGGGPSARRIATYSAAGLAAVTLILGVVEHLSWQNKVSSFADMTACNSTLPDRGGANCKQLYDDGQHAKTIAFVGYGLTAGLVATAAILFFTDPSRSGEPAKVACGPNSLVATGMTCALRF